MSNNRHSISRKQADRILAIASVNTFNETANILEIRGSSLKKRMREIKLKYGTKVVFADPDKIADQIIHENKIEESQDSLTLSAKISAKTHDRVKTLDTFLSMTEVDLETWEVSKYTLNAWDVTMSGDKSSTDQDATYTNYQIKVDLTKKSKEFDETAFFDQITDIVSRSKWKPLKLKASPVKKENLLVLTVNDLHLGRMSWAEETEVNYDSKVAAAYMKEGLDDLIAKAEGHGISEILYYVGHDFFTYDNATPFPSTTKGTPQEADSRWQKMFMTGMELQINAIKMLSQIAPITVQEISGNHDQQASFYLGQVLKVFFKDDPNVTMDISPKPRQYYRFGESLIGAGHGQKEKAIDLHAVMMAEAKKDMGDTKYWYYVLGHMHHFVEKRRRVLKVASKADRQLHGLKHIEEVDEDYKGLTITYLPNLAERDDYEVEHSYVGTIRSCVAQVYSPTKGRIAVLQHNK